MGGSTQQCKSAKGERSVCEIDPVFPPHPSSQTRWLRNRVFMAPTALSLMKDVRAVFPTCCGGRVVYLFEHIGCILYIVTSQSVPAMRSAYRVPFGSCPSMTVVFDVWYAVRLRSEPPDSG